MSLFSAMSLLFGGIYGYRSNKNPIDSEKVATYMYTTTPIFYLRYVVSKPNSFLPALVIAPIANALLIYTGYQFGRVCDFTK